MKDEIRNQLIERVAKGRDAEVAKHFLAESLASRRRTIEAQIFACLQRGEELNPQLAVQSWLALYEIQCIEAEIRSSQRVARKAGEKLKADLDPPEPKPLHYRNT